MRKFSLTVSLVVASWFWTGEFARQVFAQSTSPASSVTLYSSIKHRGERLRKCVSFRGPTESGDSGKFDLCYGSMYLGNFRDWFDTEDPDRGTVVRDLGVHEWSDQLAVPSLKPLAQLKPGEHRRLSIDVSGKDGANGADGADGRSGSDGPAGLEGRADFRGAREPGEIPGPPLAIPEASRPRSGGLTHKLKVDPFHQRALLGHLYVIHVVDGDEDFYALFRVDELEPGDRCTISWRVIPNPVEQRTMPR